MTYRDSLDYLYGLQRFGIKLGLENIRALLEALGRPDRAFGVLHVAGTNGKGSVCAALAQILQAAGYRTGLYTSPHLHEFTERIRVNGEAIPEAEVVSLTEEIRREASRIPYTFFEFTTALALRYFQRREVQFAILEVGMGGRLDATNAVTPRVCAITPISMDHAEHLGGDLADIAAEKAGILKPGVPAVIAEQPPEVLAVLQAAGSRVGAPLLCAGRDFSVRSAVGGFSFHGQEIDLPLLKPGLAGRHQHQNLSLALAAAEVLGRQGVDIPEEAMRRGVSEVRWPGRLEWWRGERLVLLDGAHNQGGAQVLADYLRQESVGRIRWVVGLKGERRPEEILTPLLPHCAALYCTVPPVDRAVSPAALSEFGASRGVPGCPYPDVNAALSAALAEAAPGEIVLVAGSLFLVAAAREALSHKAGRAA